jgi:hypothetical protein
MTYLSMNWTDKGAVVIFENTTDGDLIKSGIPIRCPRCHSDIPRNTEHRCGDKIRKPKVAKK